MIKTNNTRYRKDKHGSNQQQSAKKRGYKLYKPITRSIKRDQIITTNNTRYRKDKNGSNQ